MRWLPGSLVALTLLLPRAAPAQTPPLPDMAVIAAALGVGCDYCHGRREDGSLTSNSSARQQTARAMIEMTRELNASVQAATGRADATRVECITCHRGVAVPKQLSTIVLETVVEKGGAAAAEQYRALRSQYYGRQSYDFGEDELMGAIQRLIDRRPADAIALLEMNLEFNPQSSRSYVGLGQAYVRKREYEIAIRHLEKALELDPSNGLARGRLEQLRDDQRRREGSGRD
jgi:hypothetical protein